MTDLTIAQKIETYAQESTEQIFATLVLTDGSVQDVSYRHFSSIINKAAMWLDENLPASSTAELSTFLYVGDLNLRRLALVVAGAKTGRNILMVRRYAPDNVLAHLIAETECRAFLYESSDAKTEFYQDFEASVESTIHMTLPAWDLWNSGLELKCYGDREQSMCNPVCILHTSGSTNIPKPVVWTNRKISLTATMDYLARELDINGKKMLSTFPLTHLGGLMMSLFWPIFLGTIAVLREELTPNSPEEVDELFRYSQATLMAAQPSILSGMASSKAIYPRLRKLKFILTGSAPLSAAVVHQIQRNGGPILLNLYGATETLPLRQNVSGRDDWPYVSFKSDSGVSFCHEDGNLYELIIRKDSKADHLPSVFASFPDIEVFRSKDLFTPHPQKPGLWQFSCRKDDMLSLASGQAINVGPMEQVIEGCSWVDKALIGQDGRHSTILLVVPLEQPSSENESAQMRDSLWPYIQQANEMSRPAAAIQREMVLLLPTQDRIASTTDKGTLRRLHVYEEFKHEIDNVYAAAEKS